MPTSNDTCHGCGKRGHWKQVCQATSIHVVSESAADAEVDPQADYIVTHEVYQVQSAAKGIYVDLNIGPTSSSPPSKHFRFQVDSGCSCNTIHVNDQGTAGLDSLLVSALLLKSSSVVFMIFFVAWKVWSILLMTLL